MPSNGYMVYPEGRQFFSLPKARAAAKKYAKETGDSQRVENNDTGKVVYRTNPGRRGNPAAKVVKGHKSKAGRGFSLKNFTGTITKLRNGGVLIRGRKKK